jgi:class 3 adenylate cyclase/tetratricopeptide (TPR) repeat protein
MVCGTCGERNPERARYCWNCGARLGEPDVVLEERKVVTVLFCDLVGFTERSDQADPEDVKATLRPFHARLKREIEHFGGTLDKFIGDGALGVFGAPVAHEDDPDRAVRAALRIQEAMAEMNDADPSMLLAARAGIATGEVVVAYGEGPQIGESVTGDVVNTASRLQSVAPPGGIVVAEATYRATIHSFDYEELPAVTVKGKPEPIAIWRPLGIRSKYGTSIDPRVRPATPFVGREEELFLLKTAYRRMLRETSAQLVTVTGEPGVGKSRLIAELFAYIDELPEIVRWRVGRCLPYGDGITFWALGEIVKAQAGILESDAPEEADQKLDRSVEALFEDEQQREWISSRLAALVGASGGAEPGTVDRSEAFAAWQRYFEALASQYPLILVFEDAHWADEALLAFVDDLAGWAVDLPLLVICGARPELYDRHPGWGGGKRNSTTIPLLPLEQRETAMLLSALLNRAVLPADTQEALLVRAGGNPLYAEEFARMLTDRGLLTDRGELRASEIPVPDSLQALVAARLDTLSQSRKALLHDASVIGDVFWDGSLSAISGLPADRIRTELVSVARSDLVRRSPASTFRGLIEYSFWHPLVREVAYGQIPRTARGAKHQAVAEWFEEASGDRLGDRAEVLAHHYETALDLARSAGMTVPPELVESAGRALIAAGDRALPLDVPRAQRFYGRALELLDPASPSRLRAKVRLARSLLFGARYEDAERISSEAAESYRAAGDAAGAAAAMIITAGALTKIGQGTRSDQLLLDALSLLEGLPPGRELTRVYGRLAGSRLVASRFAESLEFAEQALRLATDLGFPDEAVRARQFRGSARTELGDPGGLEDLWEALRAGIDLGLGEETALTYMNLAYQLWAEDGPEVARQVWSAGIEFSEARGFNGHAMWGRAGLLEVLFDLGDWDEVLATADRITSWDRAAGSSEVSVFAHVYSGMVFGYRQELERADELAASFLPAARRIGHPEAIAPALYTAMVIEGARLDWDAAADIAREFGQVTAEQPGFRANYLPGIVRVLLMAGRLDEARTLLIDDGEVTARRHRLCLASARAQVVEAEGDHEAAAALYEACAHDWHEFGFALEHAQALLGHGRSLRALGRSEEAREPLEESKEIFLRLGVRARAARADDELGGLAAQTS